MAQKLFKELNAALGTYEITDILGSGGFGQVFKAVQKSDRSKEVAVKSIAKEKSKIELDQSLQREIAILKDISKSGSRSHLVTLLDVKVTPTKVLLIMECCNGGDLDDYLDKNGTLNEYTVKLFTGQIALGLSVLNKKNIIHRDLKPQNILVCYKEGIEKVEKITLKLADFGIARVLDDANTAQTKCGTPLYMAPEVILAASYDAKADLWSVGLIMFKCLTGSLPHTQIVNQSNILPLILYYTIAENPSLEKLPANLSAETRDMITSLLKIDPKQRLDFDTFVKSSTFGITQALMQHALLSKSNAGAAPIHYLAQKGSVKNMTEMLNSGADINARTADNSQAIHFAALGGHTQTTKILLDRKADPNAQDDRGVSVLHCAAQYGHTQLINLLVQHKVNINHADNDGWHAMHYAARHGHTSTITLLLKHNAKINAPTNKGNTPLHFAAEKGHLQTTKTLVDAKANINATNKNGFITPLVLAALNEHKEVVKFLLGKGAKFDEQKLKQAIEQRKQSKK